MEQSIRDLVDSIRKEGIEKAGIEAEKIIKEAEKKAESIVKKAEKEKERLIGEAEKEISVITSSSEDALRQAARNVSIQLKKTIEEEYTAILKRQVEKAIDSEGLLSLIKQALEGEITGKVVELSSKDLDSLFSSITQSFKDEISKGLEFKESPQVKSGFRISEKDGSAYVDVSSDRVTDLIYVYLSDYMKKVLGKI